MGREGEWNPFIKRPFQTGINKHVSNLSSLHLASNEEISLEPIIFLETTRTNAHTSSSSSEKISESIC